MMARGNGTSGSGNVHPKTGHPSEPLTWDQVAARLSSVAATLTEIGRLSPATAPTPEQGKAVRAAAAAISQHLSGYKRAGL